MDDADEGAHEQKLASANRIASPSALRECWNAAERKPAVVDAAGLKLTAPKDTRNRQQAAMWRKQGRSTARTKKVSMEGASAKTSTVPMVTV